MLKKEYEVLLQFARAPWKKLTFKEAKRLSGKKSESYVYNVLKKYAKRGILGEERAGNVVLYSLNLESLKTREYAGFVSEYSSWGRKHVPYKNLEKIASKIPTAFYTLIVTGSYAKGTQKEDSDIDVAIIIDDAAKPKKVYAELRMECELSIPPIHLYVFKGSEFLQMLIDKKPNYGKEIAKNNLILSGGKEYYKIMQEAVENGFDG
ncbi:MAG: nucleotidyltransferase domain-containing protein [Candidatus Aenigmarchaeota archaeon]|nr:nucleotidyltransferase domain-containing protein [Candidatus Aenigmarchaeota archaeon]